MIQATIPEVWTKDIDEATAVIENNTLEYNEKMESLLAKGWEVKQKFIKLEETEQQDPDAVTTYTTWKTEASGYVVEWTTFLTVLILVFLFREPINIGLVGLVSRRRRKAPPVLTYTLAESNPMSLP
uniref:Uncharacterized protein n=1 Tax=Cacopsylla melanoneura TaxID=428564 RepID=A0A8D8RQY1_9HEMI